MQAHYNGWIVALSVLISVWASYSALNIASRVYRTSGVRELLWLLGGSTVMGLGIWSMHFIGMLALHLGQEITYKTGLTLLSALISCGGSFVAFYLATRLKAGPVRMLFGGFCLASGVTVMHYMGMSAMVMNAEITYDPWWVAASILIALVASNAALLLFRGFRYSVRFSRWKLYSAMLMGLAVSGMHYAGMKAAQFHNHQSVMAIKESGYASFLWIGISAATGIILLVSIAAVFFERHVLEKMAYHDSLTGLPNRYGMVRYMDSRLDRSWTGAVLFIDLDRFKSVNDMYGHDIGDLLLQEVADRFRQAGGQQTLIYRLGGDEFLALIPRADKGRAEEVAQRLLTAIQSPVVVEGYELSVTASIGISMAPEHGYEGSVLMRAADTAMYHVKKTGKNRFCFFDDIMAREQARRLRLERDLQKALPRRELTIFYQPKWDAEKDRLTGMEALLRWEHPELGKVTPSEFIPIAEENGSILPITRWMLEEVCSQSVRWQEEGLAAVPVSVNISSRVLDSALLVDMIHEALTASRLAPSGLELEITESIAMANLEDTIEQLGRLEQMGVRISMDDFGTGYSSLGRIGDLPFHTLKIDRSFIQKSSLFFKQAIIRNMVAIAGNLDLGIIAEGVETREQAEFLLSTGCHDMQGYFFGKPMAADSMSRWLSEGGAAGRLAAAEAAGAVATVAAARED
ncbi:putative bifunctional diguanylate cyclase/phosphodiesterase [Paenibacillus lemnae]|uniref:EAL domain-containing protein n=1 Tax=Paenibacillus lemnae TaxID=1330551 RepID=A0A848M2T7_PAELE|nr:bifunctional diguanylate cyclase/phosphodiesterase [Paenibacillus lemnae]NMO94432.1 EAL domain-containing protein [Paenibacillus lemnae]